jgi:sugar/nucleoside kinase (ribokinase family)
MALRDGVVCGGTWLLDRISAIPDWPAEETVTEILGTDAEGGGPGFNMSVDLKKLRPDLSVEAIGLVGRDGDGDILETRARAVGVDVTQLRRTDAAPTAVTYVMTSMATGRRTFFSHQGADGLLTPDHFDFAATRGKILHLGLPGIMRSLDGPGREGDVNGWVSVLKDAGKYGLFRNLEICSLPAEVIAATCRPALPHLDSLVINDFEIGALAGTTTVMDGKTDIAAVRAAMRTVLDMGAMQVVVVHFPAGALALARDGRTAEKAPVRVPKAAIKGTNGAGDAFAAGVLLTLHDGGSLDEALTLGHAVAAASLRSLTTTGSVEPVAACLNLAAEWGWRESLNG